MRMRIAITVLALSTVIAVADSAQADTVAVASLSGSPTGRQLAASIRQNAVVAKHSVVADADIREALVGPLSEETGDIEEPRDTLLEAVEHFNKLELSPARTLLTRVEQDLLALAPTASVVRMLADVELLRGQLLLSEGESQAKAVSSFALARRLHPSRSEVDPGKFPPAVRRMYASANGGTKGSIQISSPVSGARVIVDGKDVGEAPLTLETTVGAHYVWLKRADYSGVGQRVVVGSASAAVSIKLRRDSREDRIRHRRRKLANASGAHVTTLCEQIAVLANVDLLILIDARGDGKGATPKVALFDRRSPAELRWGLPSALDAQLPVNETVVPPRFGNEREDKNGTPWYKSGWFIGAAVVVVLGGVGILSATLEPPDPSTGARIGSTWTVE